MTSYLSLITTINSLIQRIDKVKLFQDHLKLITINLIRLQHDLNEPNAIESIKYLQKNIEQTIIAIDTVIVSCTEKEVDLNGVTYRDLESLLLRFHLELAQHQANLTDNYQTRIEILSNAYHEQHSVIQKVFDEKMKLRLEIIEQNTKENTIEQLHLLREKYFNTIKHYLSNCIEIHKSVPLTGLTSDIIVKVAHIFYQISSNEQIQLEQNWQSYDLPLTRTFIQFKPDKSTPFERNESRRLLMEPESHILQGLHSRKETSKYIWKRLVSVPYMMSMTERDRYEQEENDVSEENIIRTKRWIVILGDPGSGKTSFSRWLVRHLAQTLLLNGQHSTDYGPLRIPILIRIGEFAEILKEQPSLTLFDYIGKHKWMGKSIIDDPSISLDNLSCALQDYIKHGQALIILDGLDEIPVSDQRSLIINTVENFVDTYVQTPQGISPFDNRYLNKLFDDPSRSGGNQLVITSRIVGYHAAPLAGQFSHYTIRPMDMEHMKDFIDYWFFRVHQQILDTLDLSIPNLGETHGEALKKELEKKENIGLLDVASNACLMSFICTVAFSQLEGSPLPTQRICLYQAIVNSMLTLWSSKRSTIPIPDLIQILSDIATYIHENSASGLIHEEKMKEICIQSIKDSLNKNLYNKENIQEIENQASEFVRIIREDVGILAARGESLYGFLHLTFQEYFTCLKLINVDIIKHEQSIKSKSFSNHKVRIVVQSLRRHTNDPRFRVPIALALGKISLSWSQKDFNYFCIQFIEEQNTSASILPIGAYMIISFSNDFVNYPSNDVLFDALDRLIIAAGEHQWSVVCPLLLTQITSALRKLRHDVVSLWIDNFLSRIPCHNVQTISALCHILEGKPHEFENIKWLNQSSCSMLQYLSSHNNENEEFAIDRLLVKIVFSNSRLLPIIPNTFKEFLITSEIDVNSIPVVLFSLIITLYGGLKRNVGTIVFDPFHICRESTAVTPILIRFLSKSTCNWQGENISNVKEEFLRNLLTRTECQDESSEIIDLCIATICLYGIDFIHKNAKLISKSILRKSLNRLKYISMILRQFYFADDRNDPLDSKKITKCILSMMENVEYDGLMKVHFLDVINLLKTSTARLRSSKTSFFLKGNAEPDRRVTLYLPNSLRKENNFLNYLLSNDIQIHTGRMSCSLLDYFTKLFWILEQNDEYETQYRMAVALDTIPEYLLFRNDEDLLFPLTFIPKHLRNLYLRLLEQGLIVINLKDLTNDGRQYLSFGHILVECLLVISNISCKSLSIMTALITLLPWLRIHQLENFGISLLWTLNSKDSPVIDSYETIRNYPIDYHTGLYINKIENFVPGNIITDKERRILIDKCIEQEYQRLQDILAENNQTNMNLYSACISLARVCRWCDEKNRLHLLEQSVHGAMSINNRLIRLDALCTIAFYCPTNYEQIPINDERSLEKEIDDQLHDVYPDLPLLLHTAIFIRCLPVLQKQNTINKCSQNLLHKLESADHKDQQVVYEALLPYLEYFQQQIPNLCLDDSDTIHNKSSILMKYFTNTANEVLSDTILIPNLYLMELVSDLQKYATTDDLHSIISNFNLCKNDNLLEYKLFQLEYPILTVMQTFTITNILMSAFSSPCQSYRQQCIALSNALHRFTMVEFKACRLLESWMKWKDSDELSSFAYHAALLLVGSDFWSVESAIIICDLLCCENDRFRQRAEMLLRTKNDDDIRTSSKLGLDVLLTFVTKVSHYQHTSPSVNLTLMRMFENITIDTPSHLEALLWLERYRIHVLVNKESIFNNSKLTRIKHIASYFPSANTIDVSFGENICRISNDLVQYMCYLISNNFLSFLDIDGDTVSNAVLESHTQFVVSILVHLAALFGNISETHSLVSDALITLLETSKSDEIRQAVAYAFGHIGKKEINKILFGKIQMIIDNKTTESSNYSDDVLSAFISSYCHCVVISHLEFDRDTMTVFRKLLNHSSQNVLKAVHIGLGRVLKNSSLLFEMLNSDYILCYHALIGSTAYVFLYDVLHENVEAIAEFIEQHPDLLSIFIVELYNSIRHFNDIVQHVRTTDYYLAYGYPQYMRIAELVAIRMPAAFCAFINDWKDGYNLKRALFYTSKQHNYIRRAACLTILSVFGELTIELCEMIVKALCDDPHLQNTCYKCLTRINSIKDEKIVLNLLLSYLKSKSMNIRYVTVKILLQLSQYSLIPSSLVQTVLNDLISDSDSIENLWLIKDQDDVRAKCVYYYAGPLKDVVYSLLIQHLIGETNKIMERNELNNIDADFVESEKVARLASCLYEDRINEILQLMKPAKIKLID